MLKNKGRFFSFYFKEEREEACLTQREEESSRWQVRCIERIHTPGTVPAHRGNTEEVVRRKLWSVVSETALRSKKVITETKPEFKAVTQSGSHWKHEGQLSQYCDLGETAVSVLGFGRDSCLTTGIWAGQRSQYRDFGETAKYWI